LKPENRDQVVKMLGVAGNKLRSRLGEPTASLQKSNKPLDEATSSSLEALQAFSEAEKARVTKGSLAAILFYKRAIELDPNFALSYAYVALMYINVSDYKAEIESLTRAFALRDRVGRHDRLAIEASYYHFASGELAKATQAYSDWLQSYPRDPVALENLSYLFNSIGQYPKSAALNREVIRLGPTEAFPFGGLMSDYLHMNRLDEALAVYTDARSRKVERAVLADARYYLAFLQGDEASMEEQARLAMADPEWGTLLLSDQALVEGYYGRFGRARKLWRQAADSAQRHHLTGYAAYFLSEEGFAEAQAGNFSLARKLANSALALSDDPMERSLPAVVLAVAGDGTQAESLAQALNLERPVDTIVQNYWLPSIQAGIELRQNRPAEAIDRLQRAIPYEPSWVLNLFPVYLRGQAYMQAEQAQQAAREFQSVLDHPGITLGFVTAPLAHLQLGRAQVMMDDKEAARRSYQDFLTLWKDADPDIPIYKQAKIEYAKLQ
jgi:tetratricopeptide (TPR) repeat protein